jgi:anti-sigma factor RsiW
VIQSEPLSCQQIVELVTQYLEGGMPAERRLGFEEHIAICPPCRNYFGQFRRTIQLGKQIREDELPADVRAALVDAFRDWRDRRPPTDQGGE